jgi:putative DNA primase/helicase
VSSNRKPLPPDDVQHILRTGEPDLLKDHGFHDHGNSQRLVALYGDRLRYCHAMKKWLVWDGRRWNADTNGKSCRLAKQTIQRFVVQAVSAPAAEKAIVQFATRSLDERNIAHLLKMAESEIYVDVQRLDTHPMLLNARNGTIDLATGTLRPHCADDYITKLVDLDYDPVAECPCWLRFLSEIMDGSEELVDYLQIALGYSITGDVSEKTVFVAHGSGDNGKTTMLSVVRDLIRDYAAVVALDLLTTRDESNNVAAARANLFGARLVTSSETEEGQRLSAARLKRICQGPGGEIEACRKYENPINFPETHKLWIDANHRPELPASDAAVWNRLRLIPFTVKIPKDRQDRDLKTKLMGEAGGILAWLVEGACRWRASGLPASRTVAEATATWRDEMDRLAAYLEEHTVRADDAEAWLANQNLYGSYKSWCESNGERELSNVRFSREMEAMGYRKDHRKTGNVWLGIRYRRS